MESSCGGISNWALFSRVGFTVILGHGNTERAWTANEAYLTKENKGCKYYRTQPDSKKFVNEVASNQW